MNKKVGIIIGVLLVAVLLFVGYNTFLSPKGVEGEKKVVIQVVNEKEGVDKEFTYTTDHEFLLALLQEHEEELGATFTKYDFGTMVTGLMNYEAKESESEYFYITVDGKEAETGPQEIPIMDGEHYKFELQKF
ncbi:hypothetical protein NSA47_05070 [Irregularibacter muris]|jgi:hypothetical protein|uniref:DUF4430 domain-containing protein n=1 Tax=Irregularibacter muris TaxID=1796619 RepID=A0AAE3HF83_9FIRM|nr:hypothetical protein [Irregularibacter muris]MCR1898359.1 hypothetical protein [Irregularibacter muris]